MADADAIPKKPDDTLLREFREYESGIALDNARRAAVFAAVLLVVGWSPSGERVPFELF